MKIENLQTFTTPGGDEMVVLPMSEFLKLVEYRETDEDSARIARIRQGVAHGEEELIPSEIADHLFSGKEHPLKVWRQYRGFSQSRLADEAGVKQPTISEIERGKAAGSVAALRALAGVLGLRIEDLLPLEG